jgi:hypothetical protein
MSSTSSASSNRANIRWSGFETDEMKQVSCSLLFQTDAEYVAQIVDLVPGKRTVDPRCDWILKFPSWGVIKLHAKRLGVFPESCTIGGLCKYTMQDEEDFSMQYLSRKERSNMGRNQISALDWPDYRAFCCCPLCAKSQTPGKEYYLVLYPMAQSHITAALASPVISTRGMCRLMCVPCLISILRGLAFTSVANGYEMYRGPVLDTLEQVKNLPVLQRNGIGVIIPTSPAWTLYVGLWVNSGLLETLESEDGKTAGVAASGVVATPMIYSDDIRNKKGECLVCCKAQSKLVCTRCKWAVYCSRECQKKDWKRHKIADCKSNT